MDLAGHLVRAKGSLIFGPVKTIQLRKCSLGSGPGSTGPIMLIYTSGLQDEYIKKCHHDL